MAYSVTDQNLYNEIQYHLLEVANNGASYGSGLYTTSEVVTTTNNRLQEFLKRTGCIVKRDNTNISSTANTNSVGLPADCIDVVRVGFPDTNGNIQAIPFGSTAETDTYVTNLRGDSSAAVDVPYIINLTVTSDVPQISMWPCPSASRTLDLLYTRRAATLPQTPDGTVVDCPDDFTPFVKYGALADLFGKTGETHDPVRADLCQSLFEMGVQLARNWTSGTLPGDV